MISPTVWGPIAIWAATAPARAAYISKPQAGSPLPAAAVVEEISEGAPDVNRTKIHGRVDPLDAVEKGLRAVLGIDFPDAATFSDCWADSAKSCGNVVDTSKPEAENAKLLRECMSPLLRLCVDDANYEAADGPPMSPAGNAAGPSQPLAKRVFKYSPPARKLPFITKYKSMRASAILDHTDWTDYYSVLPPCYRQAFPSCRDTLEGGAGLWGRPSDAQVLEFERCVNEVEEHCYKKINAWRNRSVRFDPYTPRGMTWEDYGLFDCYDPSNPEEGISELATHSRRRRSTLAGDSFWSNLWNKKPDTLLGPRPDDPEMPRDRHSGRMCELNLKDQASRGREGSGTWPTVKSILNPTYNPWSDDTKARPLGDAEEPAILGAERWW